MTATPSQSESGEEQLGSSELKYLIPDRAGDHLRQYLRTVCRVDNRFPIQFVSSVYFDSPELGALDEKLNSDFLKQKVRVRWYQSLSGAFSNEAFLEIKNRRGSSRSKTRVPLHVAPEELAKTELSSQVWQRIPHSLEGDYPIHHSPLVPICQITYRRERAVELFTGARIAFDSQITVTRIHPLFLPKPFIPELGVSLLEVKAEQGELPRSLEIIGEFGARRASYSKYAAALLRCMDGGEILPWETN